MPISNTLHIRKSFNNGMKSKLNREELFWRMAHFLLLALYCWLFKHSFHFINGNWIIVYHAGKLLEIRDQLRHRHGYFLSEQEAYAQMVLSGALNDKKPVSSLFQKALCSVFIFHTEKKMSGCPSPNMDVKAGKRKGEYTFFTCLDSITSVCKPGMRQAL